MLKDSMDFIQRASIIELERRWRRNLDASTEAIVVAAFAEPLQLAPQPRTATAVLERPTGAPWQLPPAMPPDEYLEKAKAIRLNTPRIVEARLDRFLVDHGWLVYDYDKVMAYLQHLAGQANPHSEARTATHSGSHIEYGMGIDNALRLGRGPWPVSPIEVYWAPLRHEDGSVGRMGIGIIYKHAVPAHALDKVYALEQEFGPEVLTFCVSDYKAVKPDPFLLVKAHRDDRGRVIDVWDEPGWGV